MISRPLPYTGQNRRMFLVGLSLGALEGAGAPRAAAHRG